MGYRGSKERNRRLKKLSRITKGYYCAAWYDEDKKRYVRYYRGKRSKYLKTRSNRNFRHDRTKDIQNCGYRKTFDFWWELY